MLTLNAHALDPEGAAQFLTVSRHEITSEKVALDIQKLDIRESVRLDSQS